MLEDKGWPLVEAGDDTDEGRKVGGSRVGRGGGASLAELGRRDVERFGGWGGSEDRLEDISLVRQWPWDLLEVVGGVRLRFKGGWVWLWEGLGFT